MDSPGDSESTSWLCSLLQQSSIFETALPLSGASSELPFYDEYFAGNQLFILFSKMKNMKQRNAMLWTMAL